jgi:hypothetical protein
VCAKNRKAARAAPTKGTMKASYSDENNSEAQAHKAKEIESGIKVQHGQL